MDGPQLEALLQIVQDAVPASGLIVGVIALILGYYQLRHLNSTYRLDSASRAVDRLMADREVRELRKLLFAGELNASPVRTEGESEEAHRIRYRTVLWPIATFHDRYAFIANTSGSAKDVILSFQVDEIRACHRILRPFIDHVRTHEKKPNFCENLIALHKYSERRSKFD